MRASGNSARIAAVGVDTAHVGQAQVHEGDVRPVSTEQPDRGDGSECVGDQDHVRLLIDHRRKAFLHQRVVVHGKNPNRGWIRHGHANQLVLWFGSREVRRKLRTSAAIDALHSRSMILAGQGSDYYRFI